MNEPRRAGRPKKHLENEHHFHAAGDMDLSVDEDVDEPAGGIMVENEPAVSAVSTLSEGWNLLETEIVLKQPPRNGMPIFLSETGDGEGVLGFWKRTRAFNGKRYEETGKWVDFQTGANIFFKPQYWKARF